MLLKRNEIVKRLKILSHEVWFDFREIFDLENIKDRIEFVINQSQTQLLEVVNNTGFHKRAKIILSITNNSLGFKELSLGAYYKDTNYKKPITGIPVSLEGSEDEFLDRIKYLCTFLLYGVN